MCRKINFPSVQIFAPPGDNFINIFVLVDLLWPYWQMEQSVKKSFPGSAPRTTSGPRIPMQINILCLVDHQIILSGPKNGYRSFSQLTVWLCNFQKKNIGTKAACKMLMKLAPYYVWLWFILTDVGLQRSSNFSKCSFHGRGKLIKKICTNISFNYLTYRHYNWCQVFRQV